MIRPSEPGPPSFTHPSWPMTYKGWQALAGAITGGGPPMTDIRGYRPPSQDDDDDEDGEDGDEEEGGGTEA
jgi:hypothetical protein